MMSKRSAPSKDLETRALFPANRQICCKAHTILDFRLRRERFGDHSRRQVAPPSSDFRFENWEGLTGYGFAARAYSCILF